MSIAEIKDEIIKNTKGLSQDKLLEILQFIQFVRLPKKDSITKELSFLDQSELNHLENEFINYKELYPHE